jgi:uncharacterized protein with HEPN domain
MSKRDDSLLLADILESIANIEEDTTGIDQAAFLNDRRRKDAVARNFGIIGEATNQLSENLLQNPTAVHWRKVVDFRNRLIHGYFGVDYKLVWEIIQEHLPSLKAEVENLFKSL